MFGLSLGVLAWTDGKRRIPLAFLPYFGEESKLDLALALLEWAEEQGFQPEGVLFDAWYAARQVLERLKLSFYPCRRRLIAGKLSLDLSLLLPVQVEAAGGGEGEEGCPRNLFLQSPLPPSPLGARWSPAV